MIDQTELGPRAMAGSLYSEVHHFGPESLARRPKQRMWTQLRKSATSQILTSVYDFTAGVLPSALCFLSPESTDVLLRESTVNLPL